MAKDTKLDRAVKRQLDQALTERLDERARQANARAVKELTGTNPDEPRANSGSFHNLCRAGVAELRGREYWRAKHELARDPGIAFSTGAEMEFRQNFPNLPDEELTVMIEEVRRARPLGR